MPLCNRKPLKPHAHQATAFGCVEARIENCVATGFGTIKLVGIRVRLNFQNLVTRARLKHFGGKENLSVCVLGYVYAKKYITGRTVHGDPRRAARTPS